MNQQKFHKLTNATDFYREITAVEKSTNIDWTQLQADTTEQQSLYGVWLLSITKPHFLSILVKIIPDFNCMIAV